MTPRVTAGTSISTSLLQLTFRTQSLLVQHRSCFRYTQLAVFTQFSSGTQVLCVSSTRPLGYTQPSLPKPRSPGYRQFSVTTPQVSSGTQSLLYLHRNSNWVQPPSVSPGVQRATYVRITSPLRYTQSFFVYTTIFLRDTHHRSLRCSQPSIHTESLLGDTPPFMPTSHGGTCRHVYLHTTTCHLGNKQLSFFFFCCITRHVGS